MRKVAKARWPFADPAELSASEAVTAPVESDTEAPGLLHLSPKMRAIAEEWLTLHDAMDTVFLAVSPWNNYLKIEWSLPDLQKPHLTEFSAGFEWGNYSRESWRAWGIQVLRHRPSWLGHDYTRSFQLGTDTAPMAQPPKDDPYAHQPLALYRSADFAEFVVRFKIKR